MKFIRSESNLRTFLWSIIAIGSIARFLTCLQHNPLDYLFSDPLRHWNHTESFFHPGFMELNDPIGYQIYLVLVRMFTGDDHFLIGATCGLLSAFMPWTYYRAGRELGMSKNVALVVWGVIVCTPSLFKIYQFFMMETLLLPLVGISLWMTARCLRRQNISSWLVAIFCWMLAVHTKISVLPFAAVCLLYVWLFKSRRISWVFFAALLIGLMLLPNALRTQKYMGFAAPLGDPWRIKIEHRSGAKTMTIHTEKLGDWFFSSPSCYIKPLEPFSQWTLRRANQDSVVNVDFNPAHGDQDWKNVYNSLHISRKEWFLQLKENMICFFFAPSWPEMQDGWDGWMTYQSRWLWAPIIFFVLAGNIRQFTQKKFYLLPVAVTIFSILFIFQNEANTEGRYRKPLEPLLILNLVFILRPSEQKEKAFLSPQKV